MWCFGERKGLHVVLLLGGCECAAEGTVWVRICFALELGMV